MKHLATIPFSGGLKISYLLPAVSDQEAQVFTIEASRVGIGIYFGEEECAAVVTAERVLEFDRRSERERRQGGGEFPHLERYFIVLDEAKTALPQELIDQLIRLKDRYRAGVVYGPDRPAHLVDSLRQAEGLTHYRERGNPRLAAQLWPSFVDWEVVAGYALMPVPDVPTVHRDLEMGLSAKAKNPEFGAPLLGKDGAEVPLLNLPGDFNNLSTRASIRSGTGGFCTALWHVFMGLHKSMPRIRLTSTAVEPAGHSLTGY